MLKQLLTISITCVLLFSCLSKANISVLSYSNSSSYKYADALLEEFEKVQV